MIKQNIGLNRIIFLAESDIGFYFGISFKLKAHKTLYFKNLLFQEQLKPIHL
jgi:hypothetical protein